MYRGQFASIAALSGRQKWQHVEKQMSTKRLYVFR